MKRLALLIAFAPVSSFATVLTPAALRERPPVASYRTSKPVPVVAQCLAESLGRHGQPAVYPANGGTAVTFTSGGITMLLVDIAPDGGIAVRRATGILAYKRKVKACI